MNPGRRHSLLVGGEPPEHRVEPVEGIVQKLAALPVRALGRDDPVRVEVDVGAAAGRRAGALGRVLHAHICVCLPRRSLRREASGQLLKKPLEHGAWTRSCSALLANDEATYDSCHGLSSA